MGRNRSADDGLLTVTRIGALTPMQLIRSYWALRDGEEDIGAAVEQARQRDATPDREDSTHQDDVFVVEEIKITPVLPQAAAPVVADDSDNVGGEVAEAVENIGVSGEVVSDTPLTIDGEVFECFPVHVSVQRQRLRVFV